MAIEKNQAHRPGPYKQTNKEHKHGRHRSKGSISIATKGKISVKSLPRKNKFDLTRDQRRNKANQIRQKKREEVLSKKRSLGGMEYAPFLVAVIPLNKEIDAGTAISILEKCDDEAIVTKSPSGITHLRIPRFKQRFSVVVPAKDNELAILDTLKVADSVLFLISAVDGADRVDNIIDNWGTKLLTSAFAQGIPTPIMAVTDLVSIAPKKRHETKQRIQKFVNKWLPEEKIMLLDTNAEGINILRRIGNQKRKSILYRDRRPHMIGERVQYLPDNEGAMGTLKVTGYLRGTPLSVNQLIHIPGLGDFQMAQIDSESDPNDLHHTDEEANILEQCDGAKQESLQAEMPLQPMDEEQTWPNNDDYEMADKDREQMKLRRKVPKGWSDYQAAWIPDDDAEFQNDEDSSSEEEESRHGDDMDAQSEADSEANSQQAKDNDDAMTESEVGINDDKYDQQIDIYSEKEELEKLKAAKSDLMFPDELDTPMDVPARERFLKYRGLESFRTSPWDPRENLPSDYTRIFRFDHFDRFRRRVMKEQKDKDGALPGWYITVHIKNVSQLIWSAYKSTESPVVLIGLFQHEHKMSVVNTVLKRTPLYDQPIKSKERLIFQCGYRRFFVNPVFSQHTNGQKHKFERFFQPDATIVATFYAPIQFPPAPVLCYKEINGDLVLVATGNLLSVNPNRLVLKRVVLSGHPFKIYKRTAVIRFMFFNREDIEYFKPCKLRTKMGRIGHIKEPLGTHGHMKCTFDGQLKSQDTVLLNLYKRVFPKWTYEELIVSCEGENTMET